jgi:lactoylglutathione lyase
MDNVIQLDHLHLISEDPQSAASWYAEKLGGKIIMSYEVLGAPQILITLGGMTFIIRGGRPKEQPSKKQQLEWGLDHFGFKVSGDFDGFCDELKKKGVPFTMDPVDFSPGLRIAFIQAPDGVSIELLQREGQ